jgi:uncharacterized repeat protein (TIGR03847 family)
MRSLGRVERFVAGADGPPGRRTFYLEADGEWFVIEKQQVAALAARSLELARQLGIPEGDPGPELGDPGDPAFRVAEIGIGIEDDEAVIVLSPDDSSAAEPVAFTVAGEQLEAMARRALAVVAAGRPACRFCGLPLDPDGHACPSSNGDLRDR